MKKIIPDHDLICSKIILSILNKYVTPTKIKDNIGHKRKDLGDYLNKLEKERIIISIKKGRFRICSVRINELFNRLCSLIGISNFKEDKYITLFENHLKMSLQNNTLKESYIGFIKAIYEKAIITTIEEINHIFQANKKEFEFIAKCGDYVLKSTALDLAKYHTEFNLLKPKEKELKKYCDENLKKKILKLIEDNQLSPPSFLL